MVSPLGYSLTGVGCKIVPVIGEGMLSERRVRVVCTAWLAAHGCNQGVEAKGLTSYGVDTYILVSHSTGSISCVYKNLHAIRLPDIKLPYSVGHYGQNYSEKTNLGALGITAIAVVERPK